MLPSQRIQGESGDMGLHGEFSIQVAMEWISFDGHIWLGS